MTWGPPSLFGTSVWSCCCGGLPLDVYLGQKLTFWFADPHREHLPVEHRPSKISVETHGAGSKPHDCALPPELPCLYDPDWPDLLPVVSASSEMDGR